MLCILMFARVLFTARRNARIASAVLATAIPSVCLSVCHTPVLYQNDGTYHYHNAVWSATRIMHYMYCLYHGTSLSTWRHCELDQRMAVRQWRTICARVSRRKADLSRATARKFLCKWTAYWLNFAPWKLGVPVIMTYRVCTARPDLSMWQISARCDNCVRAICCQISSISLTAWSTKTVNDKSPNTVRRQ